MQHSPGWSVRRGFAVTVNDTVPVGQVVMTYSLRGAQALSNFVDTW